METALGRAIEAWSQGRRVPTSTILALREEGYDPAALERFHRNQRTERLRLAQQEREEGGAN